MRLGRERHSPRASDDAGAGRLVACEPIGGSHNAANANSAAATRLNLIAVLIAMLRTAARYRRGSRSTRRSYPPFATSSNPRAKLALGSRRMGHPENRTLDRCLAAFRCAIFVSADSEWVEVQRFRMC